jgi:hypothetical protein
LDAVTFDEKLRQDEVPEMSSPFTRRRPTGSPGAKILVTAGALAATLAGWAALTWRLAGAAAIAAQLTGEVELAAERRPRTSSDPRTVRLKCCGLRHRGATTHGAAGPPPRQRPTPASAGRDDTLFQAVTTVTSVEFHAMGSHMLAATDADTPTAAARLEQVPHWFETWESRLSRFRVDSELMRLNRANGQPVLVSNVLWDALLTSIKAARLSGGLVVPTLAPWVEAAG